MIVDLEPNELERLIEACSDMMEFNRQARKSMELPEDQVELLQTLNDDEMLERISRKLANAQELWKESEQ